MDGLTDRIRASDESAFEELFRTMHAELYRFAWRMSGDDAAAQDIVQDVFLRFWEARSRLESGRSPRPLLYAMVRNAALNRIRQNRRRGWMALVDDPADDPSDPLEQRELRLMMDESIRRLPERQRQAFELSRFGDLSHADIATVMNCTVGTVNNHILAALRNLREWLKPYHPEKT